MRIFCSWGNDMFLCLFCRHGAGEREGAVYGEGEGTGDGSSQGGGANAATREDPPRQVQRQKRHPECSRTGTGQTQERTHGKQFVRIKVFNAVLSKLFQNDKYFHQCMVQLL